LRISIKQEEEILVGKIINTPYVIFQRDRRKRDIPVRKDRRGHFNISKQKEKGTSKHLRINNRGVVKFE